MSLTFCVDNLVYWNCTVLFIFLFYFRGERSFHIFYYMYDGLEAANRLEEFHLNSSSRKGHRYLKNNNDPSQENIAKFEQLNAGFKMLGFHDQEVDTVYRVLASILHLGDIEFEEILTEDNTDNKSGVIDMAPLRKGWSRFRISKKETF